MWRGCWPLRPIWTPSSPASPNPPPPSSAPSAPAYSCTIPAPTPEIEGLLAVGWALPASVTGGDSYDLWKMGDGRLGLFLGDASGHGIAPAIVVSQARTLARTLSEINCDPNWLLERINAR